MSLLTAPEIILRPVVSEKSIDQSTHGRYTFRVHPDAHKTQIKQAVEEFAAAHPLCRILVTSRTYAYQKQAFRLTGFSWIGHRSESTRAVLR